jgi:hypothetical protein
MKISQNQEEILLVVLGTDSQRCCSFPWELVKNMVAAKFMNFLGKCRYASSFSLFIRFIEYFRFVFGKPLKPLFFSTILP